MLIKVSVLFVIGVFAGTAIAASIDCNIDECRKPMKIFEELRCKAIYGAKSCCPKRFECADNVRKIDTNLCAFDGKTYRVGDVLRRNFSIDSKCHETCICSSSHNSEPAKFLCTTNNCDDISDVKVDDGCVKIYTNVKECCSTKTVCAEEKKNLATCWENSVSYREGEKFISKSNPCYECHCHKDFDNTTITENSHCRKLNCDIELKYKTFIQRGCLPIFEDDKCCPIDWKCPDGEIKKLTKRDVTEIEGEMSGDSNESEEDYSTESEEEVTDNVQKTTESAPLVTLNLDPFQFPNEELKKEILIEQQEAELPEDEETKFADELASSNGLKQNTEENSLPETTSIANNDQVAIDDESTTVSAIDHLQSFDEVFVRFSKEQQNDETPQTTQSHLNAREDETESNTENTENDTEIPSENEESIKVTEYEEEETTILPSINENSKESDISETSTTEQFYSEKIPNTDLEAPKLEISTDLEVPFNSLDEALTEETTILPESTTHEISQDFNFAESSTELPIIENIDTESPTIETEIQTTTETEIKTTQTVTQPTVTFKSNRKPKLIIKPSTYVIPPPPSPTEFEQLLTTLKQYVERLENTLAATKASETDPPATFVNYTVSRSLSGEENEETKSISKRSAPTFESRYFKHANKERGCVYGKRQYKVGEKIRTDNECLDCLCLYSPIGHCTKKKNCEA